MLADRLLPGSGPAPFEGASWQAKLAVRLLNELEEAEAGAASSAWTAMLPRGAQGLAIGDDELEAALQYAPAIAAVRDARRRHSDVARRLVDDRPQTTIEAARAAL
eukprot:4527671-Prymnesium_polylepis.1